MPQSKVVKPKSAAKVLAGKLGYHQSLVHYSKIFYVELSTEGKCVEIVGPVVFKTWIQAYRFLSDFIERASFKTVNLKDLTKVGNIYKFGDWTLEIKWMKVI